MTVLAKAVALSALVAIPAMAGDPAGLILDVRGKVEPNVSVYDEVDGGTVLKLANDATVKISHYAACEEVSVTGGTIVVGKDKLGVSGAKIRSHMPVRCPDQIVMASADLVNMAVTLRSVRKVRVMAAAPSFVLPGSWGRQFTSIDVLSKAGRMASIPVVSGRATWPADVPPLALGASYVIVLNGPGVQQQAARIDVSADSPSLTLLKGK